MRPTARVDMREWRAAAAQLFQTSSRELPDFLNGQGLAVAAKALRVTHRTNMARMTAELGQVATAVKRGPRTGRFRKERGGGRLLKSDSLAARILIKRMRLTGSWGIQGDTLIKKAINLIAARARSVNFIRSGWIPAIRILSGVVKKKPLKARVNPVISGTKQYGRPKGSAVFAIPGTGTYRTILTNTALNTLPKPPSGQGDPFTVGYAGLRAALAWATADMRSVFIRRMLGTFKRVSTK